ncbi:hypothetical protein B0J13DRAFT_588284 [Dactylonectria estremocensis]|uniref:Homeobox domain-containing protein n=1 Tax=Dactylonectria estremocensis TaxID=1079267 RepID=A0A9P9E3N9_9HYPO|nr:hypothetical protein B0J13DRAFT_588284 [Dactylonectria estremocensis]
MSLDDLLFSVGDDSAMAVPFDDADNVMSPSSSGLGAANMSHGVDATSQNPQPSMLDGLDIDWQASFEQANAFAAQSAVASPSQHADLSFLDQLGMEMDMETKPQTATEPPAMTAIDEFFITRGAHRPPVPCNNCRRRRLQCLILQTTAANPNPTKSCSSCVALFCECSLSGRGKRDPSAFETSWPVIGRLHGVSELGGSLELLEEGQSSQPVVSGTSVSALSSKRTNTRSVRKTRVLRHWFASHIDHPYPSEEEKVSLSQQSGLSKSQVVNWFANTRRRQRMSAHSQRNQGSKIFLQGSPMPRDLGMSPMERWRNSPPEEDPASASAIESALSAQSDSHGSAENYDLSFLDRPGSSTSADSLVYPRAGLHDASSNSASSCASYKSPVEPKFLSRSASSAGEGSTVSRRTSSRSQNTKFQAFQCTFCRQSYKKKYDWVRHERSIHLPGLDSWICSTPLPPDQSHLVWRMNESNPQCVFCGHVSPTDDHIRSHEFETCAERPVSERKFTRKDHLWQHLHKFHQCRKWDGFNPDLSLLQHRQDKIYSKCGFCQVVTESWDERMDHLAAHFRSGLTMESWTGGCGIEDVQEQEV